MPSYFDMSPAAIDSEIDSHKEAYQRKLGQDTARGMEFLKITEELGKKCTADLQVKHFEDLLVWATTEEGKARITTDLNNAKTQLAHWTKIAAERQARHDAVIERKKTHEGWQTLVKEFPLENDRVSS